MNHKLVIASLVFFSVAGASYADDTSRWTPLQTKGLGFALKMPGTPSVESRSVVDNGVRFTMYKYQVVRGNITFQAVAANMGSVVPAGQEDYLLRNTLESLVKANHARLVSNDLISFNGNTARMVVMKDDSGYEWNGFLCWDGTHEHVITCKFPQSLITRTVVKDFFDTFQCVNN